MLHVSFTNFTSATQVIGFEILTIFTIDHIFSNHFSANEKISGTIMATIRAIKWCVAKGKVKIVKVDLCPHQNGYLWNLWN